MSVFYFSHILLILQQFSNPLPQKFQRRTLCFNVFLWASLQTVNKLQRIVAKLCFNFNLNEYLQFVTLAETMGSVVSTWGPFEVAHGARPIPILYLLRIGSIIIRKENDRSQWRSEFLTPSPSPPNKIRPNTNSSVKCFYIYLLGVCIFYLFIYFFLLWDVRVFFK